MKIELAKELFRDSWGRRDTLTGGIATPITVLTGVGGAVALMAASFRIEGTGRLIAFASLIAAAVLSLAAATYFIARSYHGYTYQEIPNAAELDRHCRALHEFHQSIGNDPVHADADFDSYLADRFVEAADANSRNNVSKAAFLYRASQGLICAIVAAALAAVPWAMSRITQQPEPQRVTIDSPVQVQLPESAYSGTLPGPASGASEAIPSPAAPPASGTTESANSRRRTAAPSPGAASAKPEP